MAGEWGGGEGGLVKGGKKHEKRTYHSLQKRNVICS